MIPVSLLELYDSLGLTGTDKLWGGVQRYAWIDSYTAQITHAWHECIQSSGQTVHCYCSGSTLMTRDQFSVRNVLTNSSLFCFHVGADHFCSFDWDEWSSITENGAECFAAWHYCKTKWLLSVAPIWHVGRALYLLPYMWWQFNAQQEGHSTDQNCNYFYYLLYRSFH